MFEKEKPEAALGHQSHVNVLAPFQARVWNNTYCRMIPNGPALIESSISS